jgi:tRNA pseudouridine synthase 10
MGWHKKPRRFHTFEEFNFSSFSPNLLPELEENLFCIIKQMSVEKEFKTFLLSVSWPVIDPETKALMRKNLQYSLTNKIKEKLGKEPHFHSYEAEFLVDFNKKRLFLGLSPVFIKGNYCKFSRGIAQTDYYCPKCKGRGKKANLPCEHCKGTGRVTQESLADLLSQPMLKKFRALSYSFHGAGREDSDVRMLNKGRPFIIELLQPELRKISLKELEKEINVLYKTKLSVHDLEFVTSKDVAPLKNSLHEKIYLATVSCESKPNTKKIILNEQMKILQQTPTRVLKRRSDLVRTKFVEILFVKKIENENEFLLKIKASHGTYIKEFISGDNNRTNPSISSIIQSNCFCKELDVLEIC